MIKNRFILTVLAACAASFSIHAAYAAEPAWTQVGTNDAYYKYQFNATGTTTTEIKGNFVGIRYDAPNTTVTGYQVDGLVGGVRPENYGTSTVNTDIIVGDGTTATKVTKVMGAAPRGYAVTGNKSVTVNDNAYVGHIVGAVDYSKSHTSHYPNDHGALSYKSSGKWLAPKTSSDATINIKVNGGIAGLIYGGNNTSSSVVKDEYNTAKDALSAEAFQEYLKNPAWAINEKIIIDVNGGKVGYDETGTGKSAYKDAIVGGGGKGWAVNNAVEISVSGAADVWGNIFGGIDSSQNFAFQSYVKSTKISVSGGKVTGDIFGGGNYCNGAATQSTVREGTEIILSGGSVCKDDANGFTGSVYAGALGAYVDKDTLVRIESTGTAVEGYIYGGGKDHANFASVVSGNRKLEVAASHKGTQTYRVADFKNIEVAGDLVLDALEAATDADGTSVDVKQGGSITVKSGVLAGLKKLNLEGTLNIDMNGSDATQDAVTGSALTFGNAAVVNVQLDGAEDTEQIALFGFDNMNDSTSLTFTLNNAAVDSSLWYFKDGTLYLREASAATLNLNSNQSRFYAALQAMKAAGAATPELAALASSRSAEFVKSSIDALSGHEYATAMSSQMEGNLGHLRRLRSAMGKGTAIAPAIAGSTDGKSAGAAAYTPVADVRNWRAGVSTFHEVTDLDSDACGDGYKRSEMGAMLTAEYAAKEALTLGAALSYGRTKLETDGARSRNEDNTRVDVYALYGKKRWSYATSLGVGMHSHELAGADADGYSINFMQDVAYTLLSSNKSTLQAFGTLESTWNRMDGFSNGVLQADSQDAWTTDVTVGVRYSRALPAVSAKAPAGVFSVQTGVTAGLGDTRSSLDMGFNGYRYRQESASRDRMGWNLGAGVDVPVSSRTSVYGAADAVLRGDSSSVNGQVGVRVAF